MATFEKFEEKVRKAPIQSLGIGLAAAWILTRLPVLGLVGLALRVTLLLLKPALIVLGITKAWDLAQGRSEETSQASAENHY